MTYKTLIKQIAEHEGKKVEVSVGNIREVVRIIKDLCNDKDFLDEFLLYLSKKRK